MPISAVDVCKSGTLQLSGAKHQRRCPMTLTVIEQIHKNNLNILLLNSAPMTIDMQRALVFALECIEDKEAQP